MQALPRKLDVFVQILPYNCSETDYSFCEDSSPAGLRPLSGCGFHPQTPLAPPHYFVRSAALLSTGCVDVVRAFMQHLYPRRAVRDVIWRLLT